MKKTDLQKQFEEEQDREAVAEFSQGKIYLPAYGEWCERKALNLMDKAEAYDRLMSGAGKMSMQEWANFLGAPVTLDRDGKVKAHYSSPVRYSEEEGWWYNPYNRRFVIPRHLVDTHGCWPRLSITYPDGWEAVR
jgi:hypothetical protein